MALLRYSSQRSPVLAHRGVVATSHPLAVQAGIEMLRRGGNAVDAAIATAITLTVVEPTSNGIGSDAFALVWDGKRLYGLNGSGRAPRKLTLESIKALGHETMPARGWLPVTVPGAPAAWRDLHKRFGRLRFEELFEPAIFYAERGHPVAPIVAQSWEYAARAFAELKGREFSWWHQTFTFSGRAPRAGEIVSLPDHARALRALAHSYCDEFYHGKLAQQIVRFSQETGGFLSEQDFKEHSSTWIEPIKTSYRDYEVWEIPPNTQGIVALIGLNILEGFELTQHPRDSAESFHLQIEALKLAFADGLRYVADPDFAPAPTEGLLSKSYAAQRRKLITDRALDPTPGEPLSGGTVYLCTADADGMMVSFIQSNYMGFGSGIVIPQTGIALQNRGACFSLDPQHPNSLEPGKRPYHTIIPGFLTKEHRAIGPFGVMGGFMQPQGHIQMIVNTVDYRMDPQMSLDAPRWQWLKNKEIEIESDADPKIIEGLRARGHIVTVSEPGGRFGRGQIIWRVESGAYIAGSDKRADGYAAGI
ncbi:MAG: gamma-glutamyltransferase family protein [Candidatus Bipolaricaulota bacterium]|nr:gamma-glutamyltransferase family protein [Candidatus Bipolaricaulota bacterium]